MCHDKHDAQPPVQPHCCPCCSPDESAGGISRRGFLGGVGGAALSSVALSGLSWSVLAAAEEEAGSAPARRKLVVQPIFTYSTYQRRPQTSWRPWGGIQTEEEAKKEIGRINQELKQLQSKADFPVEFLPLAPVRNPAELDAAKDLARADVLLVHASDGGLHSLEAISKTGKDVIFFIRHESGPVYLWYEIISPRYLRRHTDTLQVEGIDDEDVVVDSLDEVVWRLRALCGLRNTMGSRILTVGGADAWAQPRGVVPELVRKKWKIEITDVPYPELGKLIEAARADAKAVETASRRAEAYLKLPGTTLETDKGFVQRAFLLEQIFRKIMKEADCRAMTINSCMGTIIPMSETTACLPLSLLNDDGFLAFCESDFVVIPSGLLLGNISGKPPFLQDPTYPHDGLITLAHCTAPRRMDGKNLDPARIMTHFESDYGAAPKVEMRLGQEVTMIAPDFKSERWLGLSGEIAKNPFMPICRSQIDVKFKADSLTVAQRMPGFHWMLVYGNYLRETRYALKKLPIAWDCLG